MDAEKEQRRKLEAMELEKAQRIAAYLKLQDEADRLNEEIYKAVCEVETLNARIDVLKAEMHRAALGKSHAKKSAP